MPHATPTPPLGFKVSILTVGIDEAVDSPVTTVQINGSVIKISLSTSELVMEPVSLTSPDAVGFAARRYLERLARSIESRYVDSISAARNRIANELAKAYGS
jgi:hypothetical protein